MPSKKIPRPKTLPSETYEMDTACGPIYVTITHNKDQNRPLELFIRFGKGGGCASAIADGMARIVSYALRSGMEPSLVIKGLAGIGCHQGANTCMHAIAKAFSEELGLQEYENIIFQDQSEEVDVYGG